MSILNILLASTLVSLLTLLVYLFRHSRPHSLSLPSFFLGQKNLYVFKHLKMHPPKILPILLLILLTIGSLFAFMPRNETIAKLNTFSLLLIVDRSPSSSLALKQTEDGELEAYANKVFSSVQNISFLQQNFSLKNSSVQFSQELKLNLSLDDFKKELKDIKGSGPYPFSISVNTESLKEEIQRQNLQAQSLKIYFISDCQKTTWNKFSSMAASLASELHCIPLFSPMQNLEGMAKSIIPRSILKTWGNTTSDQSNSDFVSANSLDKKMPEQAIPRLRIETFTTPSFSFVSLQMSKVKNFPLLTLCSDDFGGPQELDPFVGIVSLAQFFNTPVRRINCKDNLFAGAQEQNEAWKYRSASLWIVPVDEEKIESFIQQKETWLPREFNSKNDAIVYVAQAYSKNMRSPEPVSIQLDTDALPLAMYLLPVLPDIDLYFAPKQQSALFKPIFNAADETRLGFQLGNFPVFFLRTALSTPHGELLRSGAWVEFWMHVADSISSSTSFPTFTWKSPEDFSSSEIKFENSLEKLNTTDLKFTSISEKDFNFTVGLYQSDKKNKFLVSFPDDERRVEYLAPEERVFVASQVEAEKKETRKVTSAALHQWIGGLSAIACAICLWFLPKQLISMFLFIFVSLFSAGVAEAQNPFPGFFGGFRKNPSHSNKTISVPYRIGWCEKEVPAPVLQRYTQLRQVLASRGTIDLPEVLTADGCHVGKSEVWWSDNLASLLTTDLKAHTRGGGVFIAESTEPSTPLPAEIVSLQDPTVGLSWQPPSRRGMLYRAFYLLQSFDNCVKDSSQILEIRKKINAHSLVGLITKNSFLSNKPDCLSANEDLKLRIFVNLMYVVFSTDYKEDQLQLPSLLKRVRNLGLEP